MEKEILEKFQKYDFVCGIDEVGRGPIAGPVSVACVGIQKEFFTEVLVRLSGVTDSKKLSEKKRNFYADEIRNLQKEGKIFLNVSSVSARKIDAHGIVPALRSATKNSLLKCSADFLARKTFVYLDGSLFAEEKYDQETIIKGDAKNILIGIASVAAKVSRDNYMINISKKYPEYFFEKHKGYGTKLHYEKISESGLCIEHRYSWVKKK